MRWLKKFAFLIATAAICCGSMASSSRAHGPYLHPIHHRHHAYFAGPYIPYGFGSFGIQTSYFSLRPVYSRIHYYRYASFYPVAPRYYFPYFTGYARYARVSVTLSPTWYYSQPCVPVYGYQPAYYAIPVQYNAPIVPYLSVDDSPTYASPGSVLADSNFGTISDKYGIVSAGWSPHTTSSYRDANYVTALYAEPQYLTSVDTSVTSSSQSLAPPLPAYESNIDWVVAAMELIDQMVVRGGADEAMHACERLASVKSDLPSDFYIRAIALEAVTSHDPDKVMKWIEEGAATGCRFTQRELPFATLRHYLASDTTVDLDAALDQMALNAMKNKQDATPVLAISVLLKLDGQTARANQLALAVPKQKSSVSIERLVSAIAEPNNRE